MIGTTQPTKKEQYEREQEHLSRQLADFIHQWAPEDKRDRYRFHYEVYTLFQRAIAVGQMPLIEQLSQMTMAMAFPVVMTKGEP